MMKAYFKCVHSNFRLICARNNLVFFSVIIACVEQVPIINLLLKWKWKTS